MPRPLSVTVRKPSARQLDLDEGGVAGQRLVHRIVDHLGEQVMQRLLVGAADIHAGPPAHRLEPLQHLDVARGIAAVGRVRRRGAWRALGGARRGGAAAQSANRSGVRAAFFAAVLAMIYRCVGEGTTNRLPDYATAVAQIVTVPGDRWARDSAPRGVDGRVWPSIVRR